MISPPNQHEPKTPYGTKKSKNSVTESAENLREIVIKFSKDEKPGFPLCALCVLCVVHL
jgi:hypothetical protein